MQIIVISNDVTTQKNQFGVGNKSIRIYNNCLGHTELELSA